MGCKAKVDTSCGEGLHFEPGKGCVSAAPAPVPTTGGPSSAVPIAAVPPAQAEQSQASDVQALVTVTTKALELRQPIAFQLYRAGIPPQSFPILDAVVAVLGAQPSIRLRVEGHTDSIGSDERNLRLSQERADAVCKYLVDRGVDPARLEAKGYGPQRPIASNRSAEGRAMNARVDRSG